MLSKIKKIEEIDYSGELYDITLDNDSKLFYAKTKESEFSIQVHNCDFEQGARDLILQYLIGKYGQESVVNVPTFGTYGAKSALQAMSRGLQKETGHSSILMQKITKLEKLDVCEDLIKYFKKVREKTLDPDIINWIEGNKDTIEYAQRILGQMTQLGVHAGGIVITPGPVYDFIPVTRGSGNLIAAFREADGSSKDLGELGILKLDILGLKTLNILKFCVEKIKEDKGIDLYTQLECLDLTDKKVLDYFANGSPYGIFQMERSKMFTEKIDVDNFEDIVAINAINRPGPLEKYLNKYGYWKNIDKGKVDIDEDELAEINNERYPFPFMEKVLSPTYGCLLYQEQFMALVGEAGGFDMGEADSFRRVIAWKPDHPKFYTVEKYYQQLEENMGKKGYTKSDVDKFVEYCRDFAGYSFNKCITGDSTVITKDEVKKIIDVKIGEEILSYNPTTKKDEYVVVKRKYENGKKKVYKITTESGAIIKCTLDHKILCEDGKKHTLQDIINHPYLKIKTKV